MINMKVKTFKDKLANIKEMLWVIILLIIAGFVLPTLFLIYQISDKDFFLRCLIPLVSPLIAVLVFILNNRVIRQRELNGQRELDKFLVYDLVTTGALAVKECKKQVENIKTYVSELVKDHDLEEEDLVVFTTKGELEKLLVFNYSKLNTVLHGLTELSLSEIEELNNTIRKGVYFLSAVDKKLMEINPKTLLDLESIRISCFEKSEQVRTELLSIAKSNSLGNTYFEPKELLQKVNSLYLNYQSALGLLPTTKRTIYFENAHFIKPMKYLLLDCSQQNFKAIDPWLIELKDASIQFHQYEGYKRNFAKLLKDQMQSFEEEVLKLDTAFETLKAALP